MATRLKYFNEAKQHLQLIEMVITEFGARYKGLFDEDYLKKMIDCLLMKGYTKAAGEIAEKKGIEGSVTKQQILKVVEAELSDVRNSLGFDFSVADGLDDDEAKRRIIAVQSEFQKHLYSETMRVVQQLEGVDSRQNGRKFAVPIHGMARIQLELLYKELSKKGLKGGFEDFIRFINFQEPKNNIVFVDAKQVAATLLAVHSKSEMPVPWTQYSRIPNVGYGKSVKQLNPDTLSRTSEKFKKREEMMGQRSPAKGLCEAMGIA